MKLLLIISLYLSALSLIDQGGIQIIVLAVEEKRTEITTTTKRYIPKHHPFMNEYATKLQNEEAHSPYAASNPSSSSLFSRTYATRVHYKPHLPDDLQDQCDARKLHEPSWIPEMELLVHTRASRTILYVFCHDEKSLKRAIYLTMCYDWMFPIKLRVSRYMDNQVYKYVFAHFKDYWEKMKIRYLITVPYKLFDPDDLLDFLKVFREEFTLFRYYSYLKNLITTYRQQLEFIPLFRGHELNWLEFGNKEHGDGFLPAWEGVLLGMGYTEAQWNATYQYPPFYKNSFIAPIHIVVGLTDFMTFATDVIENNVTVAKLIGARADYNSTMTIAQLREAFNADYYCLYPFVMERLPIFYVYNLQLKVCDMNHPLCKQPVIRHP